MVTIPQKKRIANLLYGKRETTVANVAPTNFYLGLSTASALADGNVTGEVTGTGYARLQVPNNSTSFDTADNNGTVVNKQAFMWPEATDPNGWGTIHCVFISASASGKNDVLYYIPVTREIPTGATLYFNSGDLELRAINEGE